MTAPTHATFATLCYFFVATCLWWTVSPTVAAAAVLGTLLPDIDIPTSAVLLFLYYCFPGPNFTGPCSSATSPIS